MLERIAMRQEREKAAPAMPRRMATRRKLSLLERLANIDLLRRLIVLTLLCLAWETYARYLANPLILPSFLETLAALQEATLHGPLLNRIGTSLRVLAIGYASGILLAGLFTSLAVSTRAGADLLSTLTAMFNSLPAITLLPLALLWFGLGVPSIVFVIIHSVLWPVSLSTMTGFKSVPDPCIRRPAHAQPRGELSGARHTQG